MMKRLFSLTLLLLSASLALAQRGYKVFVPEFDVPIPLSDSVNSEVEEIKPMLSNDGRTLYFVRSQSDNNVGGYLAGQDIWISTKDALGDWETPVNDTSWNNKKNNGVIGVSEDGERIYMLNSYRSLRRQGRSVAYIENINGQWSKPQPLNMPDLKAGKTFYGFHMHTSEDILLISMKQKKEGFGQEDLYVCLRQADSSWSEPKNLGKFINSDRFEISPFLSKDGKTLYFSSDRRGGMGDADIYMSRRLDDSWTKWTKPINLKTLNTEHFDAYFITNDYNEVVLASNREGGFCKLYYSREKLPKDLLANKINIFEIAKDTIDYTPKNPLLSFNHEEIVAHLIEQDEDLAKLFSKDFVFFNFDSYQLKPEAKHLLDRFATLLGQYGEIKIILTGHTDSVGDPVYNLKLSKKRAGSVKSFLVQSGMQKMKISTEGRGEADPMADNESEEGRQQNRRVSIFIDRVDE